MHSRILELSKGFDVERVSCEKIPDFIFEYADYINDMSPETYPEEFKWVANFTNGTNYMASKGLMVFNPDTIVKKVAPDACGFWVYLVDGEHHYGLSHDECLMTMREFGDFLLSLYNDDNIFHCLATIDYHF